MSFSGKNVLVTGGAGFVGSHIVDTLLARGARVTIYDDLSTGFREFIAARANFVEGDLLDREKLDRSMPGHDFVFHVAANADVKDGLLHPRKDVEQNILATQNVLEAMRAHGVSGIAFASSGAVYGEAAIFPTPEAAPFPVQTSLYGASKVASEGLLSAYAEGYGFQVWMFRFVSLLGPRYTHGHVYDFWRKLRRDPTRLEVLGDGHQQKSYLHVLDCVAGMLCAIERAKPEENPHIFNLGHSELLEVNESLRFICRELGVAPGLSYTGGPRGWIGDAPKILLDTSRIRRLGWAPTRGLEESIVETLRFLIDHPFCDR